MASENSCPQGAGETSGSNPDSTRILTRVADYAHNPHLGQRDVQHPWTTEDTSSSFPFSVPTLTPCLPLPPCPPCLRARSPGPWGWELY